MKNTQEDFSSRKNTYNSSPITLAEQIYKACEQGNGAAVFLYSGQPLPKEEYPFLDKLIGKHMKLNHLPTQMDILLFLGKNSTCMKDPSIVLTAIKISCAAKASVSWMLGLSRYRKIDEGVMVKSVPEAAKRVPPEKPFCAACELKRISGEIENCLHEQTVDEKQLAVWGTELYQLIANHPQNGLIPAKNVASELQNKVNAAGRSGIFTGIEEFDRHTGGFAKGGTRFNWVAPVYRENCVCG